MAHVKTKNRTNQVRTIYVLYPMIKVDKQYHNQEQLCVLQLYYFFFFEK
eukprot:SAG11_NODE_7781_length_1096_cov_1.108216_2_plen_48_part_01